MKNDNQQKLVDNWNQKYSIGQKVKITFDNGKVMETETTHQAIMLGDHTAVSWFKGIRGCYLLSRAKAI